MRTRLVVLSVAIVIAALAVLAVRSHLKPKSAAHQPTAATAQPGSPPAATSASKSEAQLTQRQLAALILQEGLTPERAKALFSMAMGPLPGVDVPVGDRDPTDFDGTLAIIYLYRVWDSLTPEQQKAAGQLINRAENARASRSEARVTKAGFFPELIPSGFQRVVDKGAFDYQALAQNAVSTLSAILGVSPVRFQVVVDYSDPPPKSTTWAYTFSWDKPVFYGNNNKPLDINKYVPWIPNSGGCKTTFLDQRFQGASPADAEAVVTHEVFHCYQQRQAGTAEATISIPPWILEGEPTWVMATVVPAVDAVVMGPKWATYVGSPATVYLKRSYDAIGVFGHLSDFAGDDAVWTMLLPMVTMSIGNNGSDAFNAMVQGNQIKYFTSWGSSYFLVPGNTPWTMVGPGSPTSVALSIESLPIAVTLDSQTNELLAPAGPYQSGMFQLSGSADVVMVTLLTGYGRLHDQNFSLDTALDTSGPLALCLKDGGCKCPDGTAGASLITQRATAPLSIGINGGDTTAQVGVVTTSLDHFCEQKKKPQNNQPGGTPGGGGGGGGGGGENPNPPAQPEGRSIGDTHLTTLDGVHYDFQVVGEYTLVRSSKDDFVVQVRQVPIAGPKVASVNQAVATRIGGQRVTFTLERGAVVLRMDGNVISGSPPKLKSGSLTAVATEFGNAYQLNWPDGTVVKVEQLGKYALNVRVSPAASRRGLLEGLLGDFDGSPENDLIGADHVKLGLKFSTDDVNHSLADSWRVSKNTSLFDYQPGQSTETFTDPNFPAKGIEFSKIANRQAAENACREQGITDQRLLDDCILDVAATNEFIFGSQYAHAQRVLAARAALTSPARGELKETTLWMSGEILDSKTEPEFHFDANKGDVIWVHGPDCTDRAGEFHPVFILLIDPSGKPVGDGDTGCEFGRRELTVAGNYSFKAKFAYRDEITRYRIPIRFVRPDRRQQVSYGQMVSGNIEHRAAWDIYTWAGQEGDIVALEGEGCKLDMVTVILDPEGHDTLGPSCRKGTYYKLPKDGAYQLVINAGNTGEPGPYHFVFQGGKPAPP